MCSIAAAQSATDLFARAFDLLKAGDTDLAIGLFRKGLELDPEDGTANFYLGIALERMIPPDDATAVAHYRRAATLLKGSPDGMEASLRADRLEARRERTSLEASLRAERLEASRARTSLVANPSLLNGRWCYGSEVGPGVMTINDNIVAFRQGGGSNSGTLRVLTQSRFVVSISNLFSSSEDTYEMIDGESFRWISRDGNPTDSTMMRRC